VTSLPPDHGTAQEYFDDRNEFSDDVVGKVFLNQLERDCIDSPEFQRLFRISQLGFVDLLYHAANHTRGIHSIGACAKAKDLVDSLNKNTPRIAQARWEAGRSSPRMPTIMMAERCLISLAGLLHDIPHGPLSHDIEKKTHRYDGGQIKVRSYYGPYDKHDDFERNPALYLMLFDTDRSVLARVLRYHSQAFWHLLQFDAERGEGRHLKDFVIAAKEVDWPDRDQAVLTCLLFHLLVFEDLETAVKSQSVRITTDFGKAPQDWGIGPTAGWKRLHETWYQPYRHDIVGNTLSADLLDYLSRDAHRLGMRSALDLKLLEFYVLVEVPFTLQGKKEEARTEVHFNRLARCAIDLNDYKRGVIRPERINDVFRLLDRRHEIHEKAVFHRVVQSAIAMLARGVALARDGKPASQTLYGIGSPQHALHGDDRLLQSLASLPNLTHKRRPNHTIGQKLIERRVYRPLMIVPGDHAYNLLAQTGGDARRSEEEGEETLRLLGAILDSRYFSPFFCLVSWCVERLLDHSLESIKALDKFIEDKAREANNVGYAWIRGVIPQRVILWATPYKQLYKDPALIVRIDECIGRIDDLAKPANSRTKRRLPQSILERLQKGLHDAESKYAAMWKIYVFISDGLYYAGGLARLLPDHACRRERQAHKKHLEEAEACVIRAIEIAWHWWRTQSRQEGADLNNEISDDGLRRILQMYTAQPAAVRKEISAVDVEQYLHLESDWHCRDIRYRFDRKADIDRCIEDVDLPASSQESVKEFLRLARIDYNDIGQEELDDIMSHAAHLLADLEVNIDKAAREGVTLDAQLLRKEWLRVELERVTCNDWTANGSEGNEAVSHDPQSGQLDRRRGRHRHKGQVGTGSLRLLDSADSPVESGRKVPDPETPTD
jgi:HD superfamily phosphohydrolase